MYDTEELSVATCEKLETLPFVTFKSLSSNVILEPVIITFIEISLSELVDPFGIDDDDNETVGFTPVNVHVNVFDALVFTFPALSYITSSSINTLDCKFFNLGITLVVNSLPGLEPSNGVNVALFMVKYSATSFLLIFLFDVIINDNDASVEDEPEFKYGLSMLNVTGAVSLVQVNDFGSLLF